MDYGDINIDAHMQVFSTMRWSCEGAQIFCDGGESA